MGIGTQFLAIPASAYDLIYFNSPWRNPATLSHVNKVPELGLAYGNWLAGIETVGFKWRGQVSSGSGGLDIRYVGLSDIELRPGKPTAEPLGYYSAYGISARGITSWARGPFQFGIGINLVGVQIYQESTSGIAFDLGWGWSISENIKFTLSALNLGRMNKLKTVAPQLPQRVISSVSLDQSNFSVFFAVESNSLAKDPIFYSGGNGRYNNLIFGGTAMITKEVKYLSGGMGVQFGIYAVTYGFQWGDQHLGMPQMIDISIRLP